MNHSHLTLSSGLRLLVLLMETHERVVHLLVADKPTQELCLHGVAQLLVLLCDAYAVCQVVFHVAVREVVQLGRVFLGVGRNGLGVHPVLGKLLVGKERLLGQIAGPAFEVDFHGWSERHLLAEVDAVGVEVYRLFHGHFLPCC